MDRRKFFSFLGLGGGAAVSLNALKAIAPQAEAIEIRRNRQYAFRMPHHVSPESCQAIAQRLAALGLHKPIVLDPGVDIFELEASDAAEHIELSVPPMDDRTVARAVARISELQKRGGHGTFSTSS